MVNGEVRVMVREHDDWGTEGGNRNVDSGHNRDVRLEEGRPEWADLRGEGEEGTVGGTQLTELRARACRRKRWGGAPGATRASREGTT